MVNGLPWENEIKKSISNLRATGTRMRLLVEREPPGYPMQKTREVCMERSLNYKMSCFGIKSWTWTVIVFLNICMLDRIRKGFRPRNLNSIHLGNSALLTAICISHISFSLLSAVCLAPFFSIWPLKAIMLGWTAWESITGLRAIKEFQGLTNPTPTLWPPYHTGSH